MAEISSIADSRKKLEAFIEATMSKDGSVVVVYTYYDRGMKPLYVGCSKDFYRADSHNIRSDRFRMNDVAYAGFVFYSSYAEARGKRHRHISSKKPLWNRVSHIAASPKSAADDDLLVSYDDMQRYWDFCMDR